MPCINDNIDKTDEKEKACKMAEKLGIRIRRQQECKRNDPEETKKCKIEDLCKHVHALLNRKEYSGLSPKGQYFRDLSISILFSLLPILEYSHHRFIDPLNPAGLFDVEFFFKVIDDFGDLGSVFVP